MPTLSEIRDAFQQRLLTFLFRGSESSSLVLKGGGAMRVLTDSARYTQDLDLIMTLTARLRASKRPSGRQLIVP